jgi:hypothetical protein
MDPPPVFRNGHGPVTASLAHHQVNKAIYLVAVVGPYTAIQLLFASPVKRERERQHCCDLHAQRQQQLLMSNILFFFFVWRCSGIGHKQMTRITNYILLYSIFLSHWRQWENGSSELQMSPPTATGNCLTMSLFEPHPIFIKSLFIL